MESDNETIQYLTCLCLIQGSVLFIQDLSILTTEEVSAFLAKTLINKDSVKLQEVSLRLFGVLSTTESSAQFLDNHGHVETACQFIKSTNKSHQLLCLMAIASFTTSKPANHNTKEIIDTIIQLKIQQNIVQYILKILHNISQTRDGAASISNHISYILHLGQNETELHITLSILGRLLSDSNIRTLFDTEKCKEIISFLRTIREKKELEFEIAKIFELLSITDNAKQLILDDVKYYHDCLNEIPLSSLSRPTYIRIVSRYEQ